MRVFISGIGLVTPAGISRDSTWLSLLEGRNCTREIPSHWHNYYNYRSVIWSPLPDIDFKDYGFRRNEILQKDPFTLICLVATQEALKHAGIQTELTDKRANTYHLPEQDPTKSGVFIGSTVGGGDTYIKVISNHLLSRVKKLAVDTWGDSSEVEALMASFSYPKSYTPFAVPMVMPNSVSASIGIKFSLTGINRVVEHACASGTTAIGLAYQSIQRRECDYVICGGADYYSDDFGMNFRGYDVARTLATMPPDGDISKANRPFDKDRTGFVFAEGGAATLILESESHIEKRGGEPIAEIVGFGETFDAFSIMAPEPEGKQIERMIHMTLDEAGITPDEVGYINAHGTGTAANDQMEADIIERVFGKDVAINSTKSIIGHTIGASGAIEAAICALSLRDQEIHPSLNLDNPIADINFVSVRRKTNFNYTFSESFAFGGHNSGLVLKKV